MISVECHSPLIALHHGTPAFYVRQPTDTCKGQMYRDIGADEWFFEIDRDERAKAVVAARNDRSQTPLRQTPG